MKNRNYSKILVLALSVALLIGAVVGIVASAESAPEIIGKNIQYGADLKFQIAIDADSVGGAGKTVYVKTYADETKATLLDTVVAEYKDTSSTNLGVANAYVALSKNSISALAYNTEFYIVAECDGKETAITYSAIEYFLERLYGDDVTNATTEKGKAQKALYNNAISYGSSAQTLAALEGKYEGKNVADYLYYAVDGKTGIGLKGDEITLGAYTGNEANFSRWIVSDLASGNRLATLKVGDKFTLSANTVVAPYFGFRGTGDYVDQANSFDNTSVTDLVTNGWAGQYDQYSAVVNYDNKTKDYALIDTVDGDAALNFGSIGTDDPYFLIYNSNPDIHDGANGTSIISSYNDTFVFETDIRFDSFATPSSGGVYFWLGFALEETKVNSVNYQMLVYKDDNGYYLTKPGSTDKMLDIKMGEWYNLRVVAKDHCDADNTKVSVIVNGETLVDSISLRGHSYPLESAYMMYSWGEVNGSVHIDNTYFSNVYEADETYRGTGLYADLAENYTGKTATQLNANNLLATTTSGDHKFTFDNVTSARNLTVKNVNGDDALYIRRAANYDPRAIMRSSNQGFLMNSENDSLVLEFDVNFATLTRSQAGSSKTTLFNVYLDKGYSSSANIFWDGAFFVKQVDPNTGDPYFVFGSTKIENIAFNFNTWYNIRIVYSNLSAATATGTIYINGVSVATESFTGLNSQSGEIASVEFFNSWDETNGNVFIDNFYLGRP